MLSEGKFLSRGSDLKFGNFGEKGTPGVQVTMTMKEGPDVGLSIEWIGWLTEKTSARTGESLALMGYDGSDDTTVGKRDVVSVIEHEPYTKKDGTPATRARVQWINDPAAGGQFVAMNAAEVAGAKERLKAAMLAAKAAKPAAAVDPEDELRF